MRTHEEVDAVRSLSSAGLGSAAIASATGIPRSTVVRWLNGRPPRFREAGTPTCPRCGHPAHRRVDALAYCHLLGLYLGDGHVATFPRTYCLRIYLDRRYQGIIAGCVDSVRRVAPHNRVAVHHKPGCAIVQCYSLAWPCLLPQHGRGRKHERDIDLVPWQRELTHAHPEEFLRGLFESDGSRFTNPVRSKGRRYTYARYYFTNRSEDIKRLLCEHLDLLGISWRRASEKNISVARREAVAALDSFVGPKR